MLTEASVSVPVVLRLGLLLTLSSATYFFFFQLIIQGFRSYKEQTCVEPFSPRHNVIGKWELFFSLIALVIVRRMITVSLISFVFQWVGTDLEKAIFSMVSLLLILNFQVCGGLQTEHGGLPVFQFFSV